MHCCAQLEPLEGHTSTSDEVLVGPEAFDPGVRAYQDWRVRRRRVQELGRLWNSASDQSQVTTQLSDYLENDHHWQVRREVVNVFVQLGPEAVTYAAPILRVAASQDPDNVVRAAAMLALRPKPSSLTRRSLQGLEESFGKKTSLRRMLMSDEWQELDECMRHEALLERQEALLERRQALLERRLTTANLQELEESVRQDAELDSKLVEDDCLEAMLVRVEDKVDHAGRASELLHELSSVDLRSCDDNFDAGDSSTLAPVAAAWKEQRRDSMHSISDLQSVSDLSVQLDGATHQAMLRANRLDDSPRSDLRLDDSPRSALNDSPRSARNDLERELLLSGSKVITV